MKEQIGTWFACLVIVVVTVLSMGCREPSPVPEPVTIEAVESPRPHGSLDEIREELTRRCASHYGEEWRGNYDGDECHLVIRQPMPPAQPSESTAVREHAPASSAVCGTIDMETGEITVEECGEWM